MSVDPVPDEPHSRPIERAASSSCVAVIDLIERISAKPERALLTLLLIFGTLVAVGLVVVGVAFAMHALDISPYYALGAGGVAVVPGWVARFRGKRAA